MSIGFNALSSSCNANPFGNESRKAVKKDAFQISGNSGEKKEAPLTEAIRIYKNYTLTGVRELTSEEKEEIKSKIEDFMEENNFLEKYNKNKVTKDDYSKLNEFIKGLYKEFGSCGDYYEFTADFVEGMLEEAKDPNNPPRPLFKVEIPPEHALEMENMKKKPMLAAFQSPSPHQFLMAGKSSESI